MAKTFRPYDPDQMLLMPPALGDWVPEDHLARFVRDVVDALDLSAIEDVYTEERGYPPYDPRMMVTVLLYAYCTGTYSSGKIAGKLIDSVAFRFLAAGTQPDFRTISEFRRRHGGALAALFTRPSAPRPCPRSPGRAAARSALARRGAGRGTRAGRARRRP